MLEKKKVPNDIGKKNCQKDSLSVKKKQKKGRKIGKVCRRLPSKFMVYTLGGDVCGSCTADMYGLVLVMRS